jgi:hypothetical protein
MTITLEELKKMELVGIRATVPSKPRQRDLKGINFPIENLVNKEIIVIDWIFIPKDRKVINPEKPPVKFQFYLNDMLGVCFTSSEDIVESLKEYYEKKNNTIVPFPTRVVKEGKSYYFEDIIK